MILRILEEAHHESVLNVPTTLQTNDDADPHLSPLPHFFA
jgi:hypothetical protein